MCSTGPAVAQLHEDVKRSHPACQPLVSRFTQRWGGTRCTEISRQVVEKLMKTLRLFHFSCGVPASGAQVEGGKSKLFKPQDCRVSPHSTTSAEQGRGSYFSLSAPWGWCRNDHTPGFEPKLSLTLLAVSLVVNETDTSLFLFPVRTSWSVARAVRDLPGLVFRAAQLGDARVAGWWDLADALCRGAAQGCHHKMAGGISLLWTCCKGKQLLLFSNCLRPTVLKNDVRHPVCEGENGEVGIPPASYACSGSLLVKWKTKGRRCPQHTQASRLNTGLGQGRLSF